MAGLQGPSSGFAAPRGSDVARPAEVSRKIESRVFNDEPYMSAEERQRIVGAVEALGHRLNNAARAPASGRTRAIGVVQGVDGIVILEAIDEGEVSIRVDVPVHFVGAPPVSAAGRSLTADVGAGRWARTAAEDLLDLGHVTVHHLDGPQRWYGARDRLEGWRAALEVRDRSVPPVAEGDRAAASGHAAGRELAGGGDVTAVFAAGDDMPVADCVPPPSTVVRQLFDAAARKGLKLLLHANDRRTRTFRRQPTPPGRARRPRVDRTPAAPDHPVTVESARPLARAVPCAKLYDMDLANVSTGQRMCNDIPPTTVGQLRLQPSLPS